MHSYEEFLLVMSFLAILPEVRAWQTSLEQAPCLPPPWRALAQALTLARARTSRRCLPCWTRTPTP